MYQIITGVPVSVTGYEELRPPFFTHSFVTILVYNYYGVLNILLVIIIVFVKYGKNHRPTFEIF